MNRFKFKIANETDRFIVYENEFYQIRVQKLVSGGFTYNTNEKVDGLPTIYIKEDWDDNSDNKYEIECVQIQTTSYGGLDIARIEKMIEGYRIAIETVKEINKLFNLA